MDLDRIIAISAYLKEEYVCKHCGEVLWAAEVVIEKVQFNNKKVQYSASCPGCASFIRWMPQSIVGRVWYKGSMQEIAKFDTSLLQWMLRVNYSNSRRVQEDIKKVLLTRIDLPDVKDYDMKSKEQTLMDQIKTLEEGFLEILGKCNSIEYDIIHNSREWRYHQVATAQRKSAVLNKNRIKIRKELDKIKTLLADIKKNPASLG